LAQGFLVVLSNPKPLLWVGAFIPQFIDPNGNYIVQIVLLGVTAMEIGVVSDGAYAVLAGSVRHVISAHPRGVLPVSRVGGGVLIGGGLWLAFARPK
jgi:homoserine/homoserine lactone efflux protein